MGLALIGEAFGSIDDSNAARACGFNAASLGPAREFGTLRGDVDGDGSRDRVFISVAKEAPRPCRYVLVVALARGSLAAPITHEWYPRATRSFVSRYLQLHSLIALTPRGLDIVVNVDRGATTDSVAIFTVEGGNLRRRLIQERDSEHVFTHGGSVAHQHGLDCKRPRSRLLVVVGGGWQGAWQRGFWHVERRVYRASPAGPLEPVTTTGYRARDHGAAVRRFPELGTAFRSCTAVKRS